MTSTLKLVKPRGAASVAPEGVAGPVVAPIERIDEQGRLWIRHSGRMLAARLLGQALAGESGGWSELVGRSALVLFTSDTPDEPVLLGLMARSDTARREAVATLGSVERSLEIDGSSLSLQAGQQLTLRCGEASLTLSADGRIVMKGLEIVSRALRTHKIKGGSVNIN